ncbi:uncharacterized [Tachysurus ichikawai]
MLISSTSLGLGVEVRGWSEERDSRWTDRADSTLLFSRFLQVCGVWWGKLEDRIEERPLFFRCCQTSHLSFHRF